MDFLALAINEYRIHLAILVCFYLILAQSFNVVLGLGRLLNLGHVSFYALGAYTTAIASTSYELQPSLAVPLSMLVPAFFAFAVSGISLRLSEDYFAIGTLAFSAVVTAVLINWRSLTHGVLGISGIPRPAVPGMDTYQNINFLVLAASAACLSQLVLYFCFRSSFSRKLRAQSEHPYAASALGVDGAFLRTQATVISAVFAGLAGSLFAYYISYIDPSSFGLHEMVFIVSIAVVGRPGSFWGVTCATIFLVLLPEPLRFIEIPSSVLGPVRQMLYALILFAVVYWKRETLFPAERSV